MPTGKDYAVKVVKIVRPEDTGFVELLRAEYSIGSSIDHPVIRKLYELRIMRQRLRVRGAILFMEYVDGVPMSDRGFDRPLGELLGLFVQVAQGLYAMHLAGWVHADLKPENILLTADNKVKLIDLGQSSKIREAKTKIQGTIHYMAPEQAKRGVLDERTDVFGLGAALHRMITGKPVPTQMNQTVDLHSQGLAGKRVSQVQAPSLQDLPVCVTRLIEDCCHEDPAKRVRDMPTLIERIGLAQTIVTKKSTRVVTGPTEKEEIEEEETQPTRDSLFDTIMEDFAVGPEGDDPIDIDDIGEAEAPGSSTPPV